VGAAEDRSERVPLVVCIDDDFRSAPQSGVDVTPVLDRSARTGADWQRLLTTMTASAEGVGRWAFDWRRRRWHGNRRSPGRTHRGHVPFNPRRVCSPEIRNVFQTSSVSPFERLAV